jgi:hypothetical protein
MNFTTSQKNVCILNNKLFEACKESDKEAVVALIDSNKKIAWNYISALSAALSVANTTRNYEFVEFIVEKFPELKYRIGSGFYGEPHNSCKLFKEIIEEENENINTC